jgi:hypothetical protein
MCCIDRLSWQPIADIQARAYLPPCLPELASCRRVVKLLYQNRRASDPLRIGRITSLEIERRGAAGGAAMGVPVGPFSYSLSIIAFGAGYLALGLRMRKNLNKL